MRFDPATGELETLFRSRGALFGVRVRQSVARAGVISKAEFSFTFKEFP